MDGRDDRQAGLRDPYSILDAAHFEATIHAIVERGLLRGVDAHEDKPRSTPRRSKRLMAQSSA